MANTCRIDTKEVDFLEKHGGKEEMQKESDSLTCKTAKPTL